MTTETGPPVADLNERGQRLADALAGLPELWREAAMDWALGAGPDYDERLTEVLADRRIVPLLAEVDRAAGAPGGVLNGGSQAIIGVIMNPPANDAPGHEPAAAPGNAVPALRALADALERGDAILPADAEIRAGRPRRDREAAQRALEADLHRQLKRAAGRPLDHLVSNAVAVALGVETDPESVRQRRRAREAGDR